MWNTDLTKVPLDKEVKIQCEYMFFTYDIKVILKLINNKLQIFKIIKEEQKDDTLNVFPIDEDLVYRSKIVAWLEDDR